MNVKLTIVASIVVLIIIGIFAVTNGLMGHNDDQDWKVLQRLGGSMDVRTTPGWFMKRFADEWKYPKIRRRYFSSDVSEGGAVDESIKVIFSDKGKATFSTMILYSTPYTRAGEAIKTEAGAKGLAEGEVARFHRLCRGNIEIADKQALARIKEIARIAGESITASTCVEKQSSFINQIRTAAMDDKTLKSYGIEIEDVALSDIVFDKETIKQFKKQQEAILLAKEAEANKIKFGMQELETVAEYKQKIAKEKGLADMEKMKQVTNAQRDKELAEIGAQKKVEVAIRAKLEKETVASAALSVAKIVKEEKLMVASMKLEVAEIKALEAEQEKIAAILKAEGKKQAIELSGAITEIEQAMIDAGVRKVEVAAKSLSQIEVPNVMFINSGATGTGGATVDVMSNLINYRLLESTGILATSNVKTEDIAKRITR